MQKISKSGTWAITIVAHVRHDLGDRLIEGL